MSADQIMRQMDEWVAKTGCGRWADPFKPDEVTPIQAVREETEELVEQLCRLSWVVPGCLPWDGKTVSSHYSTKESGKCLEVGLGDHGGSRFLWKLMFDTVVTIENDSAKCDRWFWDNPDDDRTIINHSSRDKAAMMLVKDVGPLDFLHVDGDHTYEGVKADYLNYSPMVRSGGVVAVHDLLQPGVNRFACELERGTVDGRKHQLRRILHSTHVGLFLEVMQ